MRRGPKDRYRFSHQGKLTWLILGAVAPAVIIVIAILWFGDFSAKVQWTLAIVILTVAAGFISAARDHVVHPLQTMSNLLAALREGDYSIRARGARADDALGEVLLEVNTLGETLRVQRLGAFEATALLRTIMAEIDVAVFTFDPDRRLRLVNRAGENLLGQPMDKLLGRNADDLGLAACYDVDLGELVQRVTNLEPRLKVQIVPGPKLQIHADAAQIEQVLINLVHNAVDAALETKGAVAIRWRESGECVEVIVRDEGQGIMNLTNLFVPFFTTKPGGSGIGLKFSRQIAEAHSGTLSLTNRTDRTGAEAVLRLPR